MCTRIFLWIIGVALTTQSAGVLAQQKEPRFAWFVDYSPNGEQLIASFGGWDSDEPGEVRIWDAESFKLLHVITTKRGTRACAWSPKHNLIAMGSWGGSVAIHDSDSAARQKSLQVNGDAEHVEFTPNGENLVVATSKGEVWVFAVKTGRLVQHPKTNQSNIWGMALAPDGNTLATAGKNKWVSVSDIESGEVIHRLPHPSITNAVAFTKDTAQLVTGCWDRKLRIWDLNAAKVVRTSEGHAGTINAANFSSDDKLLATSCSDQMVRLWDYESGKVFRGLFGHTSAPFGVHFSPDGKQIATAGQEAVIKIWDVKTGRELASLDRSMDGS